MDWINFVNVFICSFIALGHASRNSMLQELPNMAALRGSHWGYYTPGPINYNIENPNRPSMEVGYEAQKSNINQLAKQAQIMESLNTRREHLKDIPLHLNEIPKQSHIMPLLKSLKGSLNDKGKKLNKILKKEPEKSPLDDIPSKFEVRGPDAFHNFKRYADDINSRAKNMSVTYKVKVELVKPKRKEAKKMNFRRKSKKYNVPLKKKSMQLSQFEIILRKLAEESDVPSEKEVAVSETTEPEIRIVTKKMNPIAKYKPVISRFKKDYVKKINNNRVKPIKTSVYTLHVD